MDRYLACGMRNSHTAAKYTLPFRARPIDLLSCLRISKPPYTKGVFEPRAILVK